MNKITEKNLQPELIHALSGLVLYGVIIKDKDKGKNCEKSILSTAEFLKEKNKIEAFKGKNLVIN